LEIFSSRFVGVLGVRPAPSATRVKDRWSASVPRFWDRCQAIRAPTP